jgi:hypothetical protein
LARGDSHEADLTFASLRSAIHDPQIPTNDLGLVQEEVVPALARYGKVDEALSILGDTTSAGAIPPYDWLRMNPRLAPLRQDPRLTDITKAARTQFDGMLQVLNQARSEGQLPSYLERPLAALLKEIALAN